jgi:type IV secretory pathway TraG/TraD family ATPase VirD4
LLAAAFVFSVLAYTGYEAERYYFRELAQGQDKLPKNLRFVFGLPIVYAISLFLLVVPVPPNFAALLSLLVFGGGLYKVLKDDHHRGFRVYRQEYIDEKSKQQLPPGDPGIPFCGTRIPTEDALCTHIAFVGTTGSGKTTAIKHILDELLPRVGKSETFMNMVIYDPKTEFYGYAKERTSVPVYSLHPWDSRGYGFAPAQIITTPKIINQYCATLIPRREGPNAYFSNAARALHYGTLLSFQKNSPGVWTFRDQCLAHESKTRLRKILERSPQTKGFINKFVNAREASSIISELDTHLSPFSSIAACWEKAEPLDLLKFMEEEAVLILPYNEEIKDQILLFDGLVLELLAQKILGRMTNEQLRAEGKRRKMTILCLDEVRDIAGKFTSLRSLLTRGRAFGNGNIIGYQSQEGLKDETSQNRAPELIGMCSHVGMMRVMEPETAHYLASFADERELFRKSPSGDKQLTKEAVLLSSALAQLPRDKLHYYGIAPEPLGLWKSETKWPERKPRPPTTPVDFDPRPGTDDDIEPWDDEDLKRLKLPENLFEEEEKDEKEQEERRSRKKEQLKRKENIDTPQGACKVERFPRGNRK